MATVGNNESGKIEEFVNSNLDRDYLKELLQDEKNQRLYNRFLREHVQNLIRQVKTRMDIIQEGKDSEEDVERLKKGITLRLGAIESMHVVKMLENLPDEEAYTNEDENVCGM